MPNLSNQDVQLAQGMFISSSTQQHPLGTRGCDAAGHVHRYVKAGAADLVAGLTVQSSVTIAGHFLQQANTTGNLTAGSPSIKVTCASTAAVGFYNEGYMLFATGLGQGMRLMIDRHAAVSTGATGEFFFYPDDPLTVAISTGTTKVSLFANKYAGVITTPATTATGAIVGVATYIITAAQFGWVQTWGPCGCVGDDTTALGGLVWGPAGTTGRVVGADATGATTLLAKQMIGFLMQTNVQAQVVMVDLRISP